MPKDGAKTRTKILNASNDLILESGLLGASIDRIIERAEITKGSFFYHFKDKEALIDALVIRFSEEDRKHLYDALSKAERISSNDPLQRLLTFVGIFIDQFSALTAPLPGCLYASYLYQKGMVSESSLRIVKEAMLLWRKELATLIIEARKKYPPRFPINPDSLADLFNTTIEGAFILAKSLDEPKIFSEHLTHYRNYLELLFQPSR